MNQHGDRVGSDGRFPDGFLWGAATSAYQVEGYPLADGAGPSIWHRFSHTPGRTFQGQTGDVACDTWHRWPEDLRLMRDLGLTAYRFSVSWSRVFPNGSGRVNEAGLAYYQRLVDALLQAGIAPSITLYHWDLPAALDDRGGWLSPDVTDWFAAYATTLFHALGDRVPFWATLNEPWVVMDGGYMYGPLAPGHRNLFEAPLVAHNLLRAHAAGVDAFRASRATGRIGLVVNIEPKHAASGSPRDETATARADAYMNRWFLDGALLGRYPEELRDIFGEAWPSWPDDQVAALARPLDWVGVNYYTRAVVRDDPAVPSLRAGNVFQPQSQHTMLGWEVYPRALTELLLGLRRRYGDVPLYITENGAAFDDPPSAWADPLPDPQRVHYLREHLRALREAIAAGVDVRGYFAWSLLDNFEWAQGFSKRFGIIHVDHASQKRTLKESALFYADVIRANGAAL